MAEADVFVQLEEEGYLFDRVSELEGLGFLLAGRAPLVSIYQPRVLASSTLLEVIAQTLI